MIERIISQRLLVHLLQQLHLIFTSGFQRELELLGLNIEPLDKIVERRCDILASAILRFGDIAAPGYQGNLQIQTSLCNVLPWTQTTSSTEG